MVALQVEPKLNRISMLNLFYTLIHITPLKQSRCSFFRVLFFPQTLVMKLVIVVSPDLSALQQSKALNG